MPFLATLVLCVFQHKSRGLWIAVSSAMVMWLWMIFCNRNGLTQSIYTYTHFMV